MYKELQEVILQLVLLLLSHFGFALIIKPDLPFSFSTKPSFSASYQLGGCFHLYLNQWQYKACIPTVRLGPNLI